jgi:beta-N-acetylglucosaminidase
MKSKYFRRTARRFAGALLAAVLMTNMIPDSVSTAYASGTDDSTQVTELSTQASELSTLAAERNIMALVYLCDKYEVREEPSLSGEAVVTVSSGQTVYIRDAVYNEKEGILWIQTEIFIGEDTYTGYIERQSLACSDERFLAWEEEFVRTEGIEQEETREDTSSYSLYSSVSSDIAQFPESYQAALTALKEQHPQWIFVPMNTGLDWDTVITEELKGGKSLVYKSFPDYTKDGAYDDGNWFYATRGILEYYMDPRNSLTEDGIFQFELLTYNETYHTEAAVEKFLQNTFMKSPDKAPGTTMTFAHIFWAIGAEKGREVSPFHLAARVYQEQGQGKSALISGTYSGYEGYYNYFNVGASGTTTTEVIVNGLKYAKSKGWNSAYYSILGGADTISANYIKKGQDTLYLEKFNVNPNASHSLYTHQYMQNISAPTTEGRSIKKLYASADSLDNSFVFKIPVYKNMPTSACPYPKPSTELTLEIPSGYDTTVWVDGVAYTPELSDGKYVVKLKNSKAKSAVVYSYDSAGVPDGMYVWTLEYNNSFYTVTAQPKLTDLLSYEGFSIRVSGSPGIRVKTGIDSDLKNTLLKTGVNGYKIKEYGTLVTDNADLTARPLVKGGKGVVADIAYGTVNGKKQDLICETVDGRQRFVYELTGISDSRYNTEFSFRSYLILVKNGVSTVVYGPVVSRSMSALAEQVLDSGTYETGSDEEIYLQKILEDAKETQ